VATLQSSQNASCCEVATLQSSQNVPCYEAAPLGGLRGRPVQKYILTHLILLAYSMFLTGNKTCSYTLPVVQSFCLCVCPNFLRCSGVCFTSKGMADLPPSVPKLKIFLWKLLPSPWSMRKPNLLMGDSTGGLRARLHPLRNPLKLSGKCL
jgi:hypothetical protein